MARAQDKYANILAKTITSAGATVVSEEVSTGISLAEGHGILIDQIDYIPAVGVYTDFIAAAASDNFSVSWSTQSFDASTDFEYTNSRLIHMLKMTKWQDAAPASSFVAYSPDGDQIFKFDPAIIVAAPKLYFSCVGSAGISGGTFNSRIYFRYVKLQTQEYLELAETFVLLS